MQTILFLEDDKVINKEISVGLKAGLGEGIRILSAYTIEEACEMKTTNQIDLYILDIELPDGSGIDFAREVREKDEDVPIMVASSHTTEKLHMKLNNELDLFLVLKKPFKAKDILPRIHSNLKKSKRRKEPVLVLRDGKERYRIPIFTVVKVETVKRAKRIKLTCYNKETEDTSIQEFPMQSMEDFMKLLPEFQGLIRVHQSTAVNPDYVIHYDGAVNELHLKYVKQVSSIGTTYRESVGLLFGRMK
ncbi:MAG: response regulator [Defluviitaleaceae bacterium]|nr:response regulator [Defluviitaleaceae bacterium]